jgi:hypothetical protein
LACAARRPSRSPGSDAIRSIAVRRRIGRDATEQCELVAQPAEIGDALPAVGEHHRQVTHDPAGIVARAALAHAHQAQRERSSKAGLIRYLGEQRRAGMPDQTLSVRRDLYLEIAAIALHPQGDLLSRGTKISTTPILQAQPDIPAPPPVEGAAVNE